MRRRRAAIKLGLVTVAAVALPLVTSGQAFADYQPQPGDIVGIGGDTPQYAVDFAINGDTSGALGYNATATVNRVVPFDAVADANGRAAYENGSTESSPLPLDPTDVLRAGTYPVQRNQSSGAAITALLADTGSPETINFIFSASLPTAAQQSTAASEGWGYLHVVQIGTDAVEIAADSTATHAPSGLSAAELLGIYDGTYTTWNELPGNSGGSADAIIPEIPPSGSSIYKTFIAALTAANGGTAPTLASDVKTVEQNDPTAVTSASDPADAIVPFSAARLNLWNDGYFHNPATVFPGSGTALSAGVTLLTGAPGDGNAVYHTPITDYVIFRESDAADPTPIEPGSALNWVQALFSNPGGAKPYFDQANTQTLLAASGITPVYDDLGDVS